MAPRKRTFDEQIERTDTCWLWRGICTWNGYGRFYLGYFNGKGRMVGAHRHAWERANRPLQPGEVVRHLCDTPLCVRPEHLVVGSQGDNLHDAAVKGRLGGAVHGKGERHRFAKLRDENIAEIRALLASGVPQRRIAERFGVHQSQISRISCAHRWSHI
jgi:predicted XRE-type DNA-binding protein